MALRFKIGIDAGVNTGFAVYDRIKGILVESRTTTFWDARDARDALDALDALAARTTPAARAALALVWRDALLKCLAESK